MGASLLLLASSRLFASVVIPPEYWAGGPCRMALAVACQEQVTSASCNACVGQHQHLLRSAGCSADVVSRWCGTAGTAQVCFDDGTCVSLARASSTPLQRASFNSTCVPSSPLSFPWGPPDVICDWSDPVHPFAWVQYMDSQPGDAAINSIPDLNSTYWADLQAVFMQSSWYLDNEKGVPTMLAAGTPLPANYRLPLIMVSSGLNRMRDLDAGSLQLLYSTIDNSGPAAVNVPADADVAPAGSIVAFSGYDGQSGGKSHPIVPYCHDGNSPSGFGFTNYDYTSFSTNLEHALSYAGGEAPTLLVFEMDSAGNQPFSGEWEYIPSPGTTWRQLACEIQPTSPNGTALHGMHAISYSYETTNRGVESAAVEARILVGLRAAVRT